MGPEKFAMAMLLVISADFAAGHIWLRFGRDKTRVDKWPKYLHIMSTFGATTPLLRPLERKEVLIAAMD
jgi:hypothetical protein